MRGNPVTLIGKPVEVGQDAPDFKVVDTDQKIWTLADTSGVRLFASVPSLDTGVCDAEVGASTKKPPNSATRKCMW
jgi:Peroxiredoxin